MVIPQVPGVLGSLHILNFCEMRSFSVEDSKLLLTKDTYGFE